MLLQFNMSPYFTSWVNDDILFCHQLALYATDGSTMDN